MTYFEFSYFSPADKKDLIKIICLGRSKAVRERISILLSFYDSSAVLDGLREILQLLPLAQQWNLASLLQKDIANELCCEILAGFFEKEKLVQGSDYQLCTNEIFLYPEGREIFHKFCREVNLPLFPSLDFLFHLSND